MYKYDLINSHYLVLIDGRRYLVDTGSESSFSLDDSLKSVTIDGVSYHLQPNRLSVQQKRETFEMVGTTFDGFIEFSKKTPIFYKQGMNLSELIIHSGSHLVNLLDIIFDKQ